MPSRLKRHDDSGCVHFLTVSCFRRLQFFRHDAVRDSFIDAMERVRNKLGIRWFGYVVMPEHVHLLVLPQAVGSESPIPISKVLLELKTLAGFGGKAALREVWRRERTLGTTALDQWATGAGEKPFWKPRGYDFNVVDEKKIVEKLQYIHLNPVRRGLVDRPVQWLWSSFRFYEGFADAKISMDWDGGFPIEI